MSFIVAYDVPVHDCLEAVATSPLGMIVRQSDDEGCTQEQLRTDISIAKTTVGERSDWRVALLLAAILSLSSQHPNLRHLKDAGVGCCCS